jgi:RHS repeat-associated protein
MHALAQTADGRRHTRAANDDDYFGGPRTRTKYGYDDQDNQTSVTAPNGANSQYAYDDLGNLLKEVSPDRGTTLYGYDAAGNLTCKADGRYSGSATQCSAVSNRWVHAYDVLNRVTSIDYLVTSGVTDTTLGYDAGTNQKGRLTSVAQVTGSETVTRTLGYDPFGNVVSTIQTLPALGGGTKTYTTGYEYTGDDSLKKVTYPSGRIAEYVRDDAGRIEQIKVTFNGTTTTLVSNVSYYPFGPPNTIVYNNGLTQTRTHDVQYRLTDLTLAGGTTLEDLAYTLDPAGNVTDLQDQLDGSYSRDYDYDVLNRLKWDDGVSSGNPTYTYDANGNRLTRAATEAGFNAQTLGYTANSNRMSAFNGTSVNYDGLGNLSSGVGAASFSYGANTRLAQIAEYSNDLYLTYNGLGELARTLQTTEDGCGGTTEINREYYHFAPDGRALGLVQEQGSRVQWDWLWLDNLPVLQFEDSYDGAGTLIGTTATYLHPDHLGTPRIGTDTAGAIQWRYRSDGFGTLTNANSREVRLRLPGQIALGLGAINYNYFRDYDPQIGRYLESDPIGISGGANTYAYVRSNPLNLIDSYGLTDEEVNKPFDPGPPPIDPWPGFTGPDTNEPRPPHIPFLPPNFGLAKDCAPYRLVSAVFGGYANTGLIPLVEETVLNETDCERTVLCKYEGYIITHLPLWRPGIGRPSTGGWVETTTQRKIKLPGKCC